MEHSTQSTSNNSSTTAMQTKFHWTISPCSIQMRQCIFPGRRRSNSQVTREPIPGHKAYKLLQILRIQKANFILPADEAPNPCITNLDMRHPVYKLLLKGLV
ncbi:hypothetical protein CEXT_617181 [Caerostris extrusa]|uniref:Uncharacterized protein n=1 Tax=Caerostris extrusa TaxID=172846 RepID=A0AAV4XQB2_CAEEX|nr:hypothetical protein CEXT_617181 [Caerostris extrusa]